MGRVKSLAGHFQEFIEKQPIKIKQNIHAVDESGSPRFHEDKLTPVMEEIEVDGFIEVRNRVWVDQVNIPFTEEEELERDAEEAMHASLRSEPQKMSVEEEMNLMLEEGADSVKTKRSEHKAKHEQWAKNHEPLVKAYEATCENVRAKQKENGNAP